MKTRLRPAKQWEDPIDRERAHVSLSEEALRNNFQVVRERVPGQSILPMVKADAYGHGAAHVARVWAREPDLVGFGVATLGEGERLRSELGLRFRRSAVIVFSGAMPWTEQKGYFCEHFGLQPVIGSIDAWRAFIRGGWHERLAYHLEWDTGMNRLGLEGSFLEQVARKVGTFQPEHRPQSVFSHLASAESPQDAATRRQCERFRSVRSAFVGAAPAAAFHLLNSAGIWNARELGALEGLDWVRPGLALYGVPPWRGAPARGLLPVLRFTAQVVRVWEARGGERIGYGGAYAVPSGQTQRVAVVSVGYADALLRSLGPQGEVWLGGRRERFLGRISMDLAAVSASVSVKVADEAVFLGPEIDLWAQAEKAGTIPYELLTSISPRVIRENG
jgi:alanine racemase